jgi:hypothetical protein
VPWPQVGPGWMLAELSSAVGPGDPPPAGATTAATAPIPSKSLFLLDPAGGRYLITTFPPSQFNAPGNLDDWSGDGQRALFAMSTRGANSSGLATVVTEVNLVTGTSASFTLAGDAGVGYTRPTGAAIIAAVGPGLDATVERLDRSGTVRLTYPTTFAGSGATVRGFLYSADGTELVLATTGGLELVTNGGQPIRALPLPGNATSCAPLSWWTSGTVLAECQSGTPGLWTVPISGSGPSALTGPPAATSGDNGDVNAWQLPGGVYVQELGGCGYIYLARLSRPGGATSPVSVLGVPSGNSVRVFGSDGTRLAFESSMACGSGTTLSWFNPATNLVTPVLGPPVTGGSALGALLFPS